MGLTWFGFRASRCQALLAQWITDVQAFGPEIKKRKDRKTQSFQKSLVHPFFHNKGIWLTPLPCCCLHFPSWGVACIQNGLISTQECLPTGTGLIKASCANQLSKCRTMSKLSQWFGHHLLKTHTDRFTSAHGHDPQSLSLSQATHCTAWAPRASQQWKFRAKSSATSPQAWHILRVLWRNCGAVSLYGTPRSSWKSTKNSDRHS